jgi:hypothetical protein
MYSQELVTSSCEQVTRVGILERHFYAMFLGINSSLLRLELLVWFSTLVFPSTKCYS